MVKEQKPLAEQIAERLIQWIVDKNMSAGDRIPNEYELAEFLNVGRNSVREAVRLLISRNILEVKRGVGTFVCQKCGVVEDPLGLTFVKDKNKLVNDLMEIRFMIEPRIATMAAERATDEEIMEIEHLCDETEQLIKKGMPHNEKDQEFHRAIARSCGNQAMENLIPIIHQSITAFIDATNSQVLQETIDTHREIVEAIKKRNGNRAYDAMILHLVYNRRNIDKNKDS